MYIWDNNGSGVSLKQNEKGNLTNDGTAIYTYTHMTGWEG